MFTASLAWHISILIWLMCAVMSDSGSVPTLMKCGKREREEEREGERERERERKSKTDGAQKKTLSLGIAEG